MAADTSRFPQGILINHSLAIASPVNTIIENGGSLFISTNATVATYAPLAPGGSYPQGTPLTFTTGTGTLSLTGGAVNVVVTDTAGVGLVFGDSVPLIFGTGLDVTFTPNGTNLVVEQGAGGGLLLLECGDGPVDVTRFVDSSDNTKRLAFDLTGLSAATTRTVVWPNFSWSPGLSVTPAVTADPGTGAAIPVTGSTSIDLTIGTGAETNTMAIPGAVGQQISIIAGTAGGGTRTITVASAINQAGNTKMAFTQANDWILLRGVSSGGTLAWRVAANDGVTLS